MLQWFRSIPPRISKGTEVILLGRQVLLAVVCKTAAKSDHHMYRKQDSQITWDTSLLSSMDGKYGYQLGELVITLKAHSISYIKKISFFVRQFCPISAAPGRKVCCIPFL